MKKVMVFGVFDGVHEGHRSFFRQAKKHAGRLVAVVTQDHVAERLKARLPERPVADRIDGLRKEALVDEVALGDAELGAWQVVLDHRPDVIAIGYDQEGLRKNLLENMPRFEWGPKIAQMEAFEPEKYHSSLLRKAET